MGSLNSGRSQKLVRRAVLSLMESWREGVKGLDLRKIMSRFDALSFHSLYFEDKGLSVGATRNSRRDSPLAPHRDLEAIQAEGHSRLHLQLFRPSEDVSGPPTLLWKAKDAVKKLIEIEEERLLDAACDRNERETIKFYADPLRKYLTNWEHIPSPDWVFEFDRALDNFLNHAVPLNRDVTNNRIARLLREIDCVKLSREPHRLDIVKSNTTLHGRPAKKPGDPESRGHLTVIGLQ